MAVARELSRIPGPEPRDYPRGIWDALFGGREPVLPSRVHLDAVMQWLCRAQDSSPDDGLARMFHVRNGWGASYPETTGYAIPTFLSYARVSADSDAAARAVRMARWESDVQLPGGAVQGGVIGDPPTPAIFNTGQVIFGWCAAFRETQDARFRESALRAAEFLCDAQDVDGAWRRDLSEFCESADDSYAFNVRSAWALLIAAGSLGNERFAAAARANVTHVISLAHENGWIEQNCLNRPEQPLLHTIAYTHQGLLEIAVLTGDDTARELVMNGSRALLQRFREQGGLYGRYEENWRPTVRWRCLTGEAQTAIVWYRLGAVTGDPAWTEAAQSLLGQLKRTHRLRGGAGIRGGVKGSHPITGAYGRLEYLNWAAKFFADALMLDIGVPGAALSG